MLFCFAPSGQRGTFCSYPGRRFATFRRSALPWAKMALPHSGRMMRHKAHAITMPPNYSGNNYHLSRENGQNPRHKADGMAMPPSLSRGILTTSLAAWDAGLASRRDATTFGPPSEHPHHERRRRCRCESLRLFAMRGRLRGLWLRS